MTALLSCWIIYKLSAWNEMAVEKRRAKKMQKLTGMGQVGG